MSGPGSRDEGGVLSAREHLEVALALLVEYRTYIERGREGTGVFIEAKALRDVELRIRRALEQLNRGHV